MKALDWLVFGLLGLLFCKVARAEAKAPARPAFVRPSPPPTVRGRPVASMWLE